ncbi:potassium channel family protein [Pannus brasiliensis CCIBt3594]|uniref:Potassium channel family protein n=1 Tax=Pannus brasiliensis CCIBt3594 TaxID=1427578 RepID=A0AAW9QX05_9CHRO
MEWQKWLRLKRGEHHYTKLLIVLLFAFFTPSLLNAWLLRMVIAILFLSLNLIILKTILTSSITLQVLKTLAVLFFLIDLFLAARESSYERWFLLASAIFQSSFIGVSILAIGQDLFQKTKVTAEVLRGAICVYLMIGFLWGIAFKIICLFDSNAFSNITLENYIYKLNYFSFITLTTVGYGDITPQNHIAMSLANVEAIIGQLFPAIVIARLVGLYEAEKRED